jgi:hypothetical protein
LATASGFGYAVKTKKSIFLLLLFKNYNVAVPDCVLDELPPFGKTPWQAPTILAPSIASGQDMLFVIIIYLLNPHIYMLLRYRYRNMDVLTM